MPCRVCDADDFTLAVDLKKQPLGNIFIEKEDIGKEVYYPLRVIYCNKCSTAQLDFTIKKEIIFNDHTYLSGVTKSLDNHFKVIAKEVDDRFFLDKKNKSVLDIGSNDGTQLKHFKDLGYDVLGVESAKTIAQIANDNGVNTLQAFFNYEEAKKINRKFNVINAAGVFFHLEELHSVTEGIKELLDEDGVFVVQCMYMKCIMENCSFDQIYHEHLLYYTLQTLEYLLSRHGLALFDAYISPIHGGSIIGFVTHKNKKRPSDRLQKLRENEEVANINSYNAYRDFASKIGKVREKNLDFLHQAKKEGKRVYGMGAPVKGNTLLNYFGIDSDLISCLVEKNELRKGMFSPGMHIPVVLEKEITTFPDVYYVLAWNFKREILANNQDLIRNGVEFFFPINPKE